MSKTKVIRAEIYLRNGSIMTAFLSELSCKTMPNKFIGELSWKNADDSLPGIFRVDVDEIIGILTSEMQVDIQELK